MALATAKRTMSMIAVRKKAKGLGITPGKMKKDELIRAMQGAEGYNQCYGSSGGQCEQTKCCFMRDCIKVKS